MKAQLITLWPEQAREIANALASGCINQPLAALLEEKLRALED